MPRNQANLVLRYLRQLSEAECARNLADRELLERFLTRHDEDAFAVLVRRHGPMVLSLCFRILQNESDAEDAFQATFLVLSRKAATLRPQKSLGGWLHCVACRTAQKARIDAARRRKHEARATATSVANPLAQITLREAQEALDRELARLPDKFRLPLVLCYLEGLTRDEAAHQLGWRPSTLKSRLEQARQRLRARLASRGLALSGALVAALFSEARTPASVPCVLLDATVRAATAISAGGTAALAVSARVAALAEGVAQAMWWSKLKPVAAVLLVLGLVGFGGGLLLCQTEAAKPDLAAQPPAERQKSERPDAPGDPLAEGAVARLGTLRFNHGDGLNALGFTPDGKTILSEGHGFLYLWDAATGKELRRIATALPSFDDQVVLTADGKRLITLNQTGFQANDTVCEWDLATGKEARVIQLPVRRKLQSVNLRNALSPDGQLAAIHTEEQVGVFDVATSRALWRLPRERAEGRGLLFAGNDWLLTVDKKELCEVWEARTGKAVRRFTIAASLELLATSADGRWLAGLEHQMAPFRLPNADTLSLHQRDLIHVWDIATGTRTHTLAARPKRWHFHLQFSPNGKLLFGSHVGDEGGELYAVAIWDAEKGQQVRELVGACGRTLAVSADGTRLAEGDQGKFALWDLKTGRRLATDDGRLALSETIFLSPRADRVRTFAYAAITTWDGTTGRRLDVVDVPSYPYRDPGSSHFFSSDGRFAGTLHEDKGRLQILIWDLAQRRRLHTLAVPGELEYMPAGAEHVTRLYDAPDVTCAFSPDASLLASWHSGKEARIRLWDLRTGREVRSFPEKKARWARHLYFTPDGKRLIIAGNRMVGCDVASGKELFSWRMTPQPRQFEFRIAGAAPRSEDDISPWRNVIVSPDGTLTAGILAGDVWGGKKVPDRIVLCETRTGKVLRRWSDSGQASPRGERLAFSRDGRLLATTDGAKVHLWEVPTGKKVHTFAGHRGECGALAFSADDRRLASAAVDSTVLLWDLTLRPVEPAAADVAAWWSDLAGNDAERAQAAVWRLAEASAVSVPLLRQHLNPVTPDDVKAIHQAIRDVDSETFTVRDQAHRRLEAWGPAAEPALRQALAKNNSLEVRQRIEQLLDQLTSRPLTGEALRTLRALAVLEHADTPEARRLLQVLADGAAEGWVTQEARAAYARLVPPSPP
jgi:RNA polymerase sigma factor (sigma-70 family)